MVVKHYDAIVVGGGVNGGAVAYALAKRGKTVLLLEKDRLASKSSGAAAGMLAAQAELNEDGPLFQLARASRSMFPAIAEEIKSLTGIDIELINKGMLKIAQSEEQEQQYKDIIAIQQAANEQADWLTGAEVRRLEPALADTIRGAMYIEKDGQVSAPKLSLGLLKAAVVQGAIIKEHVTVESFLFEKSHVTGVSTNQGTFTGDHVIVTGGAWSQQLLAQTGMHLQTYPVKGECLSVQSNQPLLSRTIFSHGCYLVPKVGGRIVIGATVKPDSFNENVTMGGIATLMEKAKNLVPKVTEAEWERAWAGIRPQTNDGLPYLGEHPNYNGLSVATGHFRNGILLAPITGELIADLVDRKPTAIDLTPFRVNRHKKLFV
ncbi:glycine oxidase ThiO [Aquibacillus sediminis]|uniref:glycine oxidase ThiO n=1 Tax=Aquibacillus sediminis TaxID=2574734 RepID=UPI001FE984F8|nr:glycine oxidase ThiO [Aquibacillus sediminis]